MNEHQEHISHYSAADIQRYVQGKLSAREMHAMEKAALDDPFLADAIEGMQLALTDHEESLVSGQLQQLQQQFQTRTTTGTGKVAAFKPFRYWQAAAAVAVIISGVWIYSLISNNEDNSEKVIATTEKRKEQQQAPAPVLHDNQELAVSADSTTAQPATPNATALTDTYKNKKEETGITAPASAVAPPVVNAPSLARQRTDSTGPDMDELKSADKLASNEKDVMVQKQEAAVAPAAVPESMKARQKADAKYQERDRETELITIPKKEGYNKKSPALNNNNLSGVIKGQVTDLHNNPVANAYILIPKNNNNIITDKTGFFNIPVSDSVVDVAVNVTGYGTQNFRLQNNAAMNQLQLQPANAALEEADEIVPPPPVKGRKLAASNGKLPNNIVTDAEPVYGWVAFDQYLEKNKRIIPGQAIAGHVVVSFQVNKKGTLSDFKIEQSLSKAYDDEAVRLIMQGPSWKLLKGRKARITVMVRF